MTTDLFAVLEGAAADAAPFVVIEAPCVPRGKGRPRSRIAYKNGKPFVIVYTDPKDVAYEKILAGYAVRAMGNKPPIPTGRPVAIRLFVMIPVPKSWPRRDRDAALAGTIFPTSKPDDDNYRKSLDAFNEIVWNDDAQVCRALTVKEYAERPGLICEVYLLP